MTGVRREDASECAEEWRDEGEGEGRRVLWGVLPQVRPLRLQRHPLGE